VCSDITNRENNLILTNTLNGKDVNIPCRIGVLQIGEIKDYTLIANFETR